MKEVLKSDPDAEAVLAAQGGDVAAFSALLRGLQIRVFRFVLRQVVSKADAEDLTQETFLIVHRTLREFRGASRFSTWVLGIAQNLVRNHCNRSPGRREQSLSTEWLASFPDHHADPETQFHLDARRQAIRLGMERFMGLELRQALILVALEGLSYEEAAQILDLPLGTLKTRVFRARKALREGLQAEGWLEGV